VLGSIIGEGVSSTFINGAFVGPLQEINPFKSYWIKPASGSATFNVTASITGSLANHGVKPVHPAGPHMTSYPFDINKPFAKAVKTGSSTFSLESNGYLNIIGEGTAMQYSLASGWTGNITEFTSGSGYWFIRSHPQNIEPGVGYNGMAIPLWRIDSDFLNFPTADAPQYPWHPCLDGNYNEHGHYGMDCTHNDDYNENTGNIGSSLGFHQEYNPFPAEPIFAHSFGHRFSSDQHLLVWSNEIGDGSGSLYDSASNDMSGSTDGTNDFIVGWFATSSVDNRFPMCCGASAWHDNQFAVLQDLTTQRTINFSINKTTQNFPFEDFGYPKPNTPIVPRIYDPRRNMLVSGSVHEVNYDSNGKPSIGDKTVLSASFSNSGFFLYMSASAADLTMPGVFSSKVIVMDH
ncbi:MAG TPA: hypothetical protein DCM40_35815, partial [Maribacter sp.]|nr:hypothetical protein [Maribacter sp.]